MSHRPHRPHTTLADWLRTTIGRDGPMPVDRFFSHAMYHPRHGYYRHGVPVGAGGDFTTAPEISQIFGELTGLWALDQWRRAGVAGPVRLVELGPGRGSMAADMCRAISLAGRERPELHVLESSPTLIAVQRQRLAGVGARWHTDIATLPDGPAVFLANEFFDALPVRQWIVRDHTRVLRRVAVTAAGRLVFTPAAPPADIFEDSPVAMALCAALARRIRRHGGTLLMVDYGYFPARPGATLQALYRRRPADPLAWPGQADLTAHVNFATLLAAAAAHGVQTHPPVGQGAFLRALGAETRAAMLCRAAPSQSRSILAGLNRLVAPDAMGHLFRAAGFRHPDWPWPAGLAGAPDHGAPDHGVPGQWPSRSDAR